MCVTYVSSTNVYVEAEGQEKDAKHVKETSKGGESRDTEGARLRVKSVIQ